jgi:6-phosphofructokinase 1
MILEVMGRNAGWIALHSGIAGGTDVILIPEIPYRVERVAEKLQRRRARGSLFATIVVAEGAHPVDGGQSVVEAARPGGLQRLGGAGARFAVALEEAYDIETRVTVLGHVQRGGTPEPTDRLLATRFGTTAVELLATGRWGHMVALHGTEIEAVPLEDIEGERLIDPAKSQLVKTARAIGISFGA